MGRRKKEPRNVHRFQIASAAQRLFMEKGMTAVSMDDIAKAAGYSKATLYVYFQNKEEIISVLVLESMKKLKDYLSEACEVKAPMKEKYHHICLGLVRYQEEYPSYFVMALDKINVEVEQEDCLEEERETYHVGEEINEMVGRIIEDGIKKGEIRSDLKIMPAIFTIWGMLTGIILTAMNKEEYIAKEMKMSKREFLEYSFEILYRSIEA